MRWARKHARAIHPSDRTQEDVATVHAVLRGGWEVLAQKKPCVDKEMLVSFLRYRGLPHAHTCQPAAGGAPSILLPFS